jgi:pyridoxamine 5'-phosphate oxidase
MDFEAPPADPVAQLQAWLRDAEETGLPNPNAMSIATVDPDGRPSVRIVLLKGLDERGAVFYTNRMSRKGHALAAHPRAALGFHWDPLHRQVTIEGAVSPVEDELSDAYFASRPRASQLGAWASAQSEPVESRAVLDAAYEDVSRRYEGGDVPRPPHWGGYRVSLDSVVFWQARAFRLHDRIRYEPDGRGGWTIRRLFP